MASPRTTPRPAVQHDKDRLLRTAQALAILKAEDAISRDDVRRYLRDNVEGFGFLSLPEENVELQVVQPAPEPPTPIAIPVVPEGGLERFAVDDEELPEDDDMTDEEEDDVVD